MGEDKALLELDGISLLQRAIGRLRSAGASPILVASGGRELRVPGCLSVADGVAGRGPLGGLVGALRAAPGELCAVVAVDMPDLSVELLQLLAALWNGEDALVPVSSDGPEPLHAVYAASALAQAELCLRSGDVSLRGLLTRLRVRPVDVAARFGPATAASFAANLNRPDQLMERRRRQRGADRPPPA